MEQREDVLWINEKVWLTVDDMRQLWEILTPEQKAEIVQDDPDYRKES